MRAIPVLHRLLISLIYWYKVEEVPSGTCNHRVYRMCYISLQHIWLEIDVPASNQIFFNQAWMTAIYPSESFDCRSDTFILCSRLYWPQNKYYLDALHKSKLRRLRLSSLSCKEHWSHENSSGAGGVFKSQLRRWVKAGRGKGRVFQAEGAVYVGWSEQEELEGETGRKAIRSTLTETSVDSPVCQWCGRWYTSEGSRRVTWSVIKPGAPEGQQGWKMRSLTTGRQKKVS